MLGLLVVLCGLAVFAACLLSGLWTLGTALGRSGTERRRTAARGGALLAAAALLAAVPWIAAPVAESSTGWVDTDNDGMLDGFANGSYDWVDINGGTWATAAAVLVVAIVVGLAMTLTRLRND
jgi:cytochrome bd-type quinol oxidase subunit 2